ncbi:MAG: hypothetical protein JWM05_85 [Acidimicrobiales bacterium]|nr:hypothetical protein [Acidimicrobiales bacterium]
MDHPFRRRRNPADRSGGATWHDLAGPHASRFGWLTEHQRARLEQRAAVIASSTRWEAARGFSLTDDMVALIAVHAALLLVELDERSYHDVSSVIVHPSTMVSREERAVGRSGVRSDAATSFVGEAHYRGPVLLSWDAVLADATHPERGHDVVFHEFAHRLDMLDGVIDGTPLLPDAAARDRWIAVCTGEYVAIRRGEGGTLLGDYAGVNPGEFFAVATEIFFTRAADLQVETPDLYAVLRDFYRQDPAGGSP